MSTLLTIGEFSKMTYLSVKALRHYHDVGLLEPAEVDPDSGYRRYRVDQVGTAQAIRRFRDLEMPIDQVRAVLDAPDLEARNATILRHLEAMQAQIEQTQRTVASLHELLAHGERARPVDVRTLPAVSALALRAEVAFDDAGAWCEATFPALRAALSSAGWTAVGPDGALYSDAFFEDAVGEVVAFVPVSGAATGAAPAGLERLELPEGRAAVLIHDGAFDDLDQTYGALGTVVAERGIGLPGPIREHYLTPTRTEVCWPVVA